MQRLKNSQVNFIRIPVYWSVAEPNMTQYLIEVENINREAGRRGILVQWDNHHFHTGPYNGGDGFPRTWTNGYPLDTSISKTSDRAWRFWQAYLYREIPGLWEAQWDFLQKVFDAAKRGNEFGNWVFKEYLNEPQVPRAKNGETNVRCFQRYRDLYEFFETRFRARYGDMPTVICEGNGIGQTNSTGSLMPPRSVQHTCFPRNGPSVIYAAHRYNSPLDEEFGQTMPQIINNAKNNGIVMYDTGGMVQEWNTGGTGLPNDQATMTLYQQKLKQYNWGWTIWAMFGGSNSRNVFVESTSDPTGWTVRSGIGQYFFNARRSVYGF
jgi:hypothetical protein